MLSAAPHKWWCGLRTGVAFSFEAEVVGGELDLSDETTEFGYFAVNELDTIDLMEHHRQRVKDATENRAAVSFR